MIKNRAKIAAILILAALTACGKVGPLEPKAGQAPPVKAYGQAEVPSSETLVTASEQARPGRSDELMRRSERRTDDPFDLPPGSEPKPVEKQPDTAPAKPPKDPQ
jgi:predicted small lipoprotein YifL